MNLRKFPGPWRVEITEGTQFGVKDANDFALAHVYARSDSTLNDKYLTPAGASTKDAPTVIPPTGVAPRQVMIRLAQCGDYCRASDGCGFGIDVIYRQSTGR